jgi:hypothetical protein
MKIVDHNWSTSVGDSGGKPDEDLEPSDATHRAAIDDGRLGLRGSLTTLHLAHHGAPFSAFVLCCSLFRELAPAPLRSSSPSFIMVGPPLSCNISLR